jgi:aldose 1-epimerase
MMRRPSSAEPFGNTPDGRKAALYTLDDEQLRVRITDYGGRIVSIEAPDRNGTYHHVVLGFDCVANYVTAGGAFGALLGRTANRIAGGQFTLDGQSYRLSKNEGSSTLHGGLVGFHKVFWQVEEADARRLILFHVSHDDDQGFPGELSVRATYRIESNTLWLGFEAETTKATPVSLSAHPYFNLAGPTPDVLEHEVTIDSAVFLPIDAKQIPTGELRAVGGTAFDFREPRRIGARIREPDPQLLLGKGYDHYFVLSKTDGGRTDGDEARIAARVRDAQSGRVLEVLTTQPGIQFYTGNNLNGSIAGRSGVYRQSAGFAIEPHGYPDAPNRSAFPSTILRPGAKYRRVIGYRFTAD